MRRFWWITGLTVVGIAGIGTLAIKRTPASAGPPARPPAEAGDRSGRKVEPSPSPEEIRALLAQAERARIEGNLLEAKQGYQQIIQQAPATEQATAAQQRLGEVNLRIILSPTPAPEAVAYLVQPGDTLSKIAGRFGTTVELLKTANRLSTDRIRPDQRLKVTKAAFNLIVDKSQNTLALKNGEEVLKVYRCSTGEGGNTPTGTFRIVNRIVNPTWFSPQGVIPPGDPRNLLGSRWLGFDQAGYGIHGTTDPSSIGKPVTQGCVRLANADAEELFALLPEGTPVVVLD